MSAIKNGEFWDCSDCGDHYTLKELAESCPAEQPEYHKQLKEWRAEK